MTITLKVFSLASIIGVLWGSYALANGFRGPDGSPFYLVPQAAVFFVLGAAGWVVFSSLSKIMERLERLGRRRQEGTTLSTKPLPEAAG